MSASTTGHSATSTAPWSCPGREGSDEPLGRLFRQSPGTQPKAERTRPRRAPSSSTCKPAGSQGSSPSACDVVRFGVVELDVAEIVDLADLREHLVRARQAAAGKGRGEIARAAGQLVGQGELSSDLRRPGSIDDLLETLRDDFAEDEPFCWWDTIDDRSRAAVDLELIRSGSDFAADLVAMADELKRCLESEEEQLEELAAELSDGLPGAA